MSGVNLDLLCFARGVPRAVANLLYAEWDEASLYKYLWIWGSL